MEKRIFILFSVMLIFAFFVSGCPSGQTKTEVESTDLLVIKDVIAIPSAELEDSSKLVVRMEVQNAGQNELWMLVDDDSKAKTECDPGKKKDCFDGDMVLVDYCGGLYTLTDFSVISKAGTVCSDSDPDIEIRLGGTKDEISSATGCYLKFDPHQVHIFQWKITTPSKEDIGDLVDECDFNLQTIYSGKAKTVTYVYFAVPQEVAQRVYTGKDLTLVGDNVASYGPVVANFETGEAQPITAGLSDTWTVYLNLKNLGSGIAKIGRIELKTGGSGIAVNSAGECDIEADGGGTYLDASELEGELEGMFSENSQNCEADERNKNRPERCEYDGCDYLEDEKREVCESKLSRKNKLEIFKTESSRISCTMDVPSEVLIMQPYRFTTVATYAYSQGRSLKIKTKPHVA